MMNSTIRPAGHYWLNLLFGAGLLVIGASCGKEEHRKRFDWVRSGNRLYYDFYGLQDTIPDFRYLHINGSKDVYAIREHNPASNRLTPLFGDMYDQEIIVKAGGLHVKKCSSCSFGSCISTSAFLYAPNAPSLHQELPFYYCGDVPDRSNYVVNTDTTLTVPLGTFSAYILQHPNGDKSYWNPREGLLMYEVRNINRTALHGTLRLNRIVR